MNNICHWELQTSNPDKAKKFYESLFGWKLTHEKEMNYVLVDTIEQPGGGLNIVNKVEPSGAILYVQVEDIEATLNKATQLGGKVITPKSAIPNIGFFGIFNDSEGNKVGLFTPSNS
jgi:predicted enzyme related to lactoylglutathione lyase